MIRKNLYITFFVSIVLLISIPTLLGNSNNLFSYTKEKHEINTICVSASISGLYESADPVELGDFVIIRVEVLDPQGFKQVVIELEGTNRSMTNIQGDTWEYNWTPSSVGFFPYTIYSKFNMNKWNSLSDSIEVKMDATPPDFEFVEDFQEKIKIGKKIKIKIRVTDPNGIKQVFILIQGKNHSMTNIPGTDIWEYDSWAPSSSGVYYYKICMEDTNSNSICTNGIIQIIDEDNEKDTQVDEPLWILPLIIGTIGAISGILTYKKVKTTQQRTPNKSNKAKNTTNKPNVEKTAVSVVCPICKTKARILIPKTVINEAKSLTTISIPRNLTCEHHYQSFIDKNFIVRGYQKVDYEFEPEQIDDIEVLEENQPKV